jgi:protein-tyrosine phosphatase
MWESNLSWVTPLLALGGSFPASRALDVVRLWTIKAVVDLRAEACDDEQVLCSHGLAFLHLPTDDLCAVSQSMLDEGVAFTMGYLNAGERVLIHCEHGIGRSATLALCVLVGQGYAPLDALELAKSRRPLVSPSPVQYEAWAAWLVRWRESHRPGWEIPHFDAFKAIAYRHLQGAA